LAKERDGRRSTALAERKSITAAIDEFQGLPETQTGSSIYLE
jgi:hypothetical protein